jgi:hypothetical protein
MTFHDYTGSGHIDLTLHDEDQTTYAANVLNIAGDQAGWVAEAFDGLKLALDAVQPQSVWLVRHKTIFLNLLALGLGCTAQLLLKMLALIGINVRIDGLRSPAPLVLVWIFSYVVGITFALWVRDWVFTYWPKIEFNFGLPHLNVERRRREKWGLAITLVLVPIFINLLTDAIPRLFP